MNSKSDVKMKLFSKLILDFVQCACIYTCYLLHSHTHLDKIRNTCAETIFKTKGFGEEEMTAEQLGSDLGDLRDAPMDKH